MLPSVSSGFQSTAALPARKPWSLEETFTLVDILLQTPFKNLTQEHIASLLPERTKYGCEYYFKKKLSRIMHSRMDEQQRTKLYIYVRVLGCSYEGTARILQCDPTTLYHEYQVVVKHHEEEMHRRIGLITRAMQDGLLNEHNLPIEDYNMCSALANKCLGLVKAEEQECSKSSKTQLTESQSITLKEILNIGDQLWTEWDNIVLFLLSLRYKRRWDKIIQFYPNRSLANLRIQWQLIKYSTEIAVQVENTLAAFSSDSAALQNLKEKQKILIVQCLRLPLRWQSKHCKADIRLPNYSGVKEEQDFDRFKYRLVVCNTTQKTQLKRTRRSDDPLASKDLSHHRQEWSQAQKQLLYITAEFYKSLWRKVMQYFPKRKLAEVQAQWKETADCTATSYGAYRTLLEAVNEGHNNGLSHAIAKFYRRIPGERQMVWSVHSDPEVVFPIDLKQSVMSEQSCINRKFMLRFLRPVEGKLKSKCQEDEPFSSSR